MDAVELFRTGSGDELTCCTARPAGTDPIHRQLTEHTGAVTDGERLVHQYCQHPRWQRQGRAVLALLTRIRYVDTETGSQTGSYLSSLSTAESASHRLTLLETLVQSATYRNTPPGNRDRVSLNITTTRSTSCPEHFLSRTLPVQHVEGKYFSGRCYWSHSDRKGCTDAQTHNQSYQIDPANPPGAYFTNNPTHIHVTHHPPTHYDHITKYQDQSKQIFTFLYMAHDPGMLRWCVTHNEHNDSCDNVLLHSRPSLTLLQLR